jgi:hypothetical protein
MHSRAFSNELSGSVLKLVRRMVKIFSWPPAWWTPSDEAARSAVKAQAKKKSPPQKRSGNLLLWTQLLGHLEGWWIVNKNQIKIAYISVRQITILVMPEKGQQAPT